MPTKPATKPAPAKPSDIFRAARSVYTRRKSLLAKADQLLDYADPLVKAIVSSLEDHELNQPIDLVPSSPESE